MEQYKLENSPIVYYISRKERCEVKKKGGTTEPSAGWVKEGADGTKQGEWLLFLHAAFVNHRMFSAQAKYFKNRYNVLLVDIIGHGASTDTKKGDSLDKMSAWIYDIMKKEKIEKIHIVGVSLGAVLAQDFANHYPDAVSSLACFGGYNINYFERSMQKENGAAQMRMMLKAIFSIKWFAAANKKISAFTPRAQNDFYAMNIQFPKSSFRYLASLNRMVNRQQTGKRDYPLLIGCGRYDIPAELDAVKMWQEDEPECRVVVFENAGHCVNMDVPQEFNRVLEENVKRANVKGAEGR